MGPQSHGVAVEHHGIRMYVTCENIEGGGPPPHHPTSGSRSPGYVVVIDAATQTVVQTFEVANFAAVIVYVR